MVDVIGLVVQLRWVGVLQQVVVPELGDLGSGRPLDVGGVGADVEVVREGRQLGIVGEGVLILEGHRIAVLGVEGLVAIRLHLMGIDDEIGFPHVAGRVFQTVDRGVPGAVGTLGADALLGLEHPGEQVDGAAVVGGSEGRGGTGAAVDIGAAQEHAWEEGPGMVGRAVGVLEWNPIEGHRVVAIREAAEERLGITQARAVGAVAEHAGGHLDHLGIVHHGGRELADELVPHVRLGRTGRERALGGRGPGGDRVFAGHDTDDGAGIGAVHPDRR